MIIVLLGSIVVLARSAHLQMATVFVVHDVFHAQWRVIPSVCRLNQPRTVLHSKRRIRKSLSLITAPPIRSRPPLRLVRTSSQVTDLDGHKSTLNGAVDNAGFVFSLCVINFNKFAISLIIRRGDANETRNGVGGVWRGL